MGNSEAIGNQLASEDGEITLEASLRFDGKKVEAAMALDHCSLHCQQALSCWFSLMLVAGYLLAPKGNSGRLISKEL